MPSESGLFAALEEVLAHHSEVKVLQQGSDVIIDLPTVSVII